MSAARLQLGARHAGSPSSPVVDFLIPGLDDLHCLAWGTSRGSIAVSCAQVGEVPLSGSGDRAASSQQASLHSALVLDLTHPPPLAQPLEEAVLHVSYGGGPRLLLAAATEQWLVVCSLERFAASAFSTQTGGEFLGDAAGTPANLSEGGPASTQAGDGNVGQSSAAHLGAQQQEQGQGQNIRGAGLPQLYCQLAAVRCSGGPILGISWTQQLDGILVSQADGSLTMWQLASQQQPDLAPQESLAQAPPGRQLGAGPSPASLPQRQQERQQAGVGPARSTDAAVDALPDASVELLPAWRALAPAPQDLLSAGASVVHPCASSASGRKDKGANIWWPPDQLAQKGQQAEQPGQQQAGMAADSAAVPPARCERLKHPCALTGLEWSPGVLQKDLHNITNRSQAAVPGLPAEGAAPAAPWDDHPALMTVGADGVIRLWVEMVVVVQAPPGSPAKQGEGRQLLPGPSSPQIESYFCMALVIEPPQHSVHSSSASEGTQPRQHAAAVAGAGAGPAAVAATWGRSPGCLLGRAPHHGARAAAPVLWLLSSVGTAQHSAGGAGGCTLRVHAVRGLSPVVMSSYLGAMSSGSTGSSPRPQALLWGQHPWEGACCPSLTQHFPLQLQQQQQQQQQPKGSLSCWVTAEDEFPTLHVVSTEAPCQGPQLKVQCCSLATVEEEAQGGSPGSVHRRLAMASSWHVEHATHSQEVSSLLACPAAPLLASLDGNGVPLLWHSTGAGLLHALGPLYISPAAAGPVRALGWAPAGAAGPGTALLAAATPSCLLFFSVSRRRHPAGHPHAQHGQQQQHAGAQQWEVASAACCDLPASLPAVHALHLLHWGGAVTPSNTGSSGTGGSDPGQQLLVAAMCRGPSGASLHLQHFTVQRQPAGSLHVVPAVPAGPPGAPLQLLLPQLHGFPAAVTSSIAVPSKEGPRPDSENTALLAVGLANSRLQLLRLGEAADNGKALKVELLAELRLGDAPAALAAAPGAEFLAAITAGHQDRLELWRRASLSSCHGGSLQQACYASEASLPLPDTPTTVAWLGGMAAPALAVGCAGEGVAVFAKGARSGIGPAAEAAQGRWAQLAVLPGSDVPGGVSHLALASSGVLVGAGSGGELFSLHSAVAPAPELIKDGSAGGASCSLARLVLDRAGPLPQYHPATLAALLLAGRARGVAAVLRALLAWMKALRQHRGKAVAQELNGPGVGGGEAEQALSPVAIGRTLSRQLLEAGGAEPAFQSVPLAELVESFEESEALAGVAAGWRPTPVAKGGTVGGAGSSGSGRVDSSSAAAALPAQPRSAVDAGQLDMAALGMDGFGAEPAPAAPSPPAASAVESGQLDMSAFGLDGFAAPAAHAAPASAMETGQLDMSAFGMDGFVAPAAHACPASAVETGQLDMSAFGMGGFGAETAAAAVAPQPAVSALATGQLDVSAFGMDGFGIKPAPAAAPGPSAALPVETGQLDMSAFGMDGFGAESAAAAPQPAASALATGQLDMSAFGMYGIEAGASPAAAPQPAASAVETGQLDMSAFGMDGFGMLPAAAPPPAAAAAAVEMGQLDISAFNKDSFGAPAAHAAPASAVETGQLDMSAFGMDSFVAPAASTSAMPASAAVETGQLDMSAFGIGSFGAPAPQLASKLAPSAPPTVPAAPAALRAAPPLPASSQPKPPRPRAPLTPTRQLLAPAERLRPLPAELAHQLLQELESWALQQQGSPAQEDDTSGLGEGPTAYTVYASPSMARPISDGRGASDAPSSPSQLTPLPGLTASESAALVALLRALAPAPSSSATGAGGLGGAGGPVDTCGAHFLSALTLALASQQGQSVAEQQQGAAGEATSAAQRGLSSSSSASLARGGLGSSANVAAAASSGLLGGLGSSAASGLFSRPKSIKNAAGVEYTLPPASSASLARLGSEREGAGAGAMPLEQAWGLKQGLGATAVLWAALSGTQHSLLSHAVEQSQRAEQGQQQASAQQGSAEPSFLAVRKQADASQQHLSWELLRGLGAGFWLSDPAQVHEVAESLAKAQFAASRNPDDCALLYCALGKKAVLQGLYRTTQNRKLSEFLSRDFSQPAHAQAARKNAFVLLGQHRHGLAGAFFILGGAPEDAVGVCAREMKDIQLALFLCRAIWGPGSEAERRVVERDILPFLQEVQGRQRGTGSAGAGAKMAAQAPGASVRSAARLGQSLAAAGPHAGSDAVQLFNAAAQQAVSSAEGLCKWLLGDAAGAALALLDAGQAAEQAQQADCAQQQSSMTSAEAAQLLPLLLVLLPSAAQAPGQHLPAAKLRALLAVRCMAAADTLQAHGVHALALSPLLAAVQLQAAEAAAGGCGQGGVVAQTQLQAACTLCLLRTVLSGAAQQGRLGWRELAQQQIQELQRLGLKVDAEALLSTLRSMSHQLAAPPASAQRIPAYLLSPAGLNRRSLHQQRSPGSTLSGHSARSSLSAASGGSGRGQGAGQEGARQRGGKEEGGETQLLGDGHLVFRVDGDRGEALACSPSLSPEGGGRALVLATRRHGLVEGEACLLPSEGWGAQEEAVSPSPSDSSRSSAQRGSVFSRLLDQLFEQTRFESDWMAGEGELSTTAAGAMMAAAGGGILYGGGSGIMASSVTTSALCAHPSRNLFLSSCASGRVHLWQFGGRQALASFSPVPQADLGEARGTSLLSFSNRLRGSNATSRLANWGRCTALRFSPNGERFAAAGEGGVVATWRLDSHLGPARPTDGDGAACSDWWHTGLGRGARAVEYVGGSSSVVAVGGRCNAGEAGNIAVWDTLAPPASAGVGRLGQHQAPVTALCMLPGGWLLASGDEGGALSLSDVRMMGAGKAARVLWSVRAAHGPLASIAWAAGGAGHLAPHSVGSRAQPSGRLSGWLVTGGQDGVVRCWQAVDGQLLQSAEPWRQRAERAGGGVPVGVTGLAVCAEGVVASCADGAVRLLPFCRGE